MATQQLSEEHKKLLERRKKVDAAIQEYMRDWGAEHCAEVSGEPVAYIRTRNNVLGVRMSAKGLDRVRKRSQLRRKINQANKPQLIKKSRPLGVRDPCAFDDIEFLATCVPVAQDLEVRYPREYSSVNFDNRSNFVRNPIIQAYGDAIINLNR